MAKILTPFVKDQVCKAIASTNSMRAASRLLEWPYKTFIYRAKKLGLYVPNQAGIGTVRVNKYPCIPLNDILAGLHPTYSTGELKRRLVHENILPYVCVNCNNTGTWMGQELILQLNHINGDSFDHRLSNLELLCPNCHSQTITWSGRNKNKKVVSDNELIEALKNTTRIVDAFQLLGISKSATNYNRAKRLKLQLQSTLVSQLAEELC